ncbi:MAG: hypothetical protein WC383_17920 [Gammaproteobacteria bacterium]
MDLTFITDLLSGKCVRKRYQEMLESQWYSRGDIQELQLIKLQKLMSHCYQNVPFYRNFMKMKGIVPTDFCSLSMIDELPIVTKETIKKNYIGFTPKNIGQIKGVKTSQTGGTTGSILIKRNDANTRSIIWAAYKRYEDWMRYKPGDKSLILMGGHVIMHHGYALYHDRVKRIVIDALKNQISINPYNTDKQTTSRIVEVITHNKIALIRGYSQYLYNLCQILKARGIGAHIPIVSTTAEPLMPEHRAMYLDVLGSEAFDQYGCGEIGGISFECDKHQGMHIAEEHVIVEQNAQNDLIVTDLDNYSMPFIRYHNGDQAIMDSSRCRCGREHRLIRQVNGRICDYVVGANDEYLHWAYFWHLVFDSGITQRRDLKKFQIIQSSKEEIIFKYVADKLSPQEEKVISDNIQSRLGGIKVRFSQEDDIPNAATGKYRPVINELLLH